MAKVCWQRFRKCLLLSLLSWIDSFRMFFAFFTSWPPSWCAHSQLQPLQNLWFAIKKKVTVREIKYTDVQFPRFCTGHLVIDKSRKSWCTIMARNHQLDHDFLHSNLSPLMYRWKNVASLWLDDGPVQHFWWIKPWSCYVSCILNESRFVALLWPLMVAC